MEGYISTQAAADKIGVSARRVLFLIKAGALPGTIKIGEGYHAQYWIWPADLRADRIKHRKPGRPWEKIKAAEKAAEKAERKRRD